MRDLINIVTLLEGVTFRPAVKEMIDGQTYIAFPPAGTTEVSEPCPGCEYHREYFPDWNPENCEDCFGKGTIEDTKYHFPNMDVSVANSHDVANMLGEEDDDGHGWIEPDQLPNVMRRLIALKNGDSSSYTRDSEVSPSRQVVDRSGDIPRIRSTMRMISGGRSQDLIDRYIDRLMEIVRWAQQNGCGVSWA